jgi:hypothetical protein
LIIQRIALAHHPLCARLVAPQIGIFGFAVQLGEAPARSIDVKDASSAARPTARYLRQGFVFLRAWPGSSPRIT